MMGSYVIIYDILWQYVIILYDDMDRHPISWMENDSQSQI